MKFIEFVLLILISISCVAIISSDKDAVRKLPTVLISTLIRNKGHTLPYFFTYLEKLNYPKDRIALCFRSDHNEDNSIELTHLWLNKTSKLYHYVNFEYEENQKRHKNETSPTDWPKDRFSHIIKLKEDSFEEANKLWADFIFFLDADVFLTNPNTLTELIKFDLPIVAPMLSSEGLYSNFWCGMSENYYYLRTDEYKQIYENKKNGNYPVPMIHSSVLVNLNYVNSNQLTFDRSKLIEQQKRNLIEKIYDGPLDDIIIFAISANSSGIPMYISNAHPYGYILQPLEKEDEILQDFYQLENIKLNIITDLGYPITVNDEFRKFVHYPEKHKLSLDHIYMINLERRPERRSKMELLFKELGLDVEYFPAMDGKKLNVDIVKKMGINFLSEYEDPYHHRKMTMGEIGCFLSHYRIWEKMVELEHNEVLILEDDIRFEPYFKDKAISVLNQARKHGKWNLIYFGRKRLESEDEPWVDGTKNLVHVGYSYWTLGYVINLEGAKKLLASKPLEKLLPVDEFLPIMFGRHPNDSWSSAFENKNLVAFSSAPLILFPTHYTGDVGYISDTEDSQITPPADSPTYVEAKLKSDKPLVSLDDYVMEDAHKNGEHNNVFADHLAKSMKPDHSEL
ncbi:glycosyltransferase 25 family member [Condylostylus longicornis]|uniref:glycosyltransferase 25 family member n=1 Tax=Condylostylus longicornis TaxID=2530218 RepID=UPI00244E3F6F|nr:glycosyltransferase 25 family member [Condylostylus longicornis]